MPRIAGHRQSPNMRSLVRPRRQTAGRPRGSIGRPGWLSRRFEKAREAKLARREKRAYEALSADVLSLVEKDEVEEIARETAFYRREPQTIKALPFVLCAALAAMGEAKRGFATVWRMLQAVARIEVARSAVTQRFGAGSAQLMERVFLLAVQRLPGAACPEMLSKLDEFRAVLAHDGSVVTLSPLLKKLFPATRTHSVKAAGKVHATADLVQRRIVEVKVTGERDSELAVARAQPVQPQVLYINDLGYTSYDYFAELTSGNAEVLSRLKDNANPTLVAVRHGIRAPVAAVQRKLGLSSPELQFTQAHGSFDVDARFKTKKGSVVLRVVGLRNPETGKYHRYVTSLKAENFSPDELANLYSLRWWIELLFKVLKSSCHMDHLDTSKPDAIRTHIYASLLAATILSGIHHAAASTHGITPRAISPLIVGIAAPLLVIPLMLLWLQRHLTPEELADSILRIVAIGCRDQNPGRTRDKWAPLGQH